MDRTLERLDDIARVVAREPLFVMPRIEAARCHLSQARRLTDRVACSRQGIGDLLEALSARELRSQSSTPARLPLSPISSIEVSSGGQLQFVASLTSPLPL